MNRTAIPETTREARAVACPDCNMFQLCVLLDRREPDLALLELIVERRRELSRGEHLYWPGASLFCSSTRSAGAPS